MDSVTEEKLGMEIHPSGRALGDSKPSTDKFSKKRMANKQRRKRAHKRKLSRSNTNG